MPKIRLENWQTGDSVEIHTISGDEVRVEKMIGQGITQTSTNGQMVSHVAALRLVKYGIIKFSVPDSFEEFCDLINCVIIRDDEGKGSGQDPPTGE